MFPVEILYTHVSEKRGTDAMKRALADVRTPIPYAIAYGDRRSMLEAVLDAHYRGVKIVHVGAGETNHWNNLAHPDHKTRDAISMLSEHLCVANWDAAWNAADIGFVVREDVDWERVHITGCPSLDEIVALSKTPAPERDGSVFEWFPETARTFTPTDWPRLSEAEFLQRLRTCSLFRTNSSAGLREAPILGTPVEMIGDRQKGRIPGPYHHPEGTACEGIRRIVLEVCK